MTGYYSERLSAKRLERCYEIAPARINQYLKAEIEFLANNIDQTDLVLELGCGYGRILSRLKDTCAEVVGLDISLESLRYGRTFLSHQLTQMDAGTTGIQTDSFDVVVCIQNGISAFKVEPVTLVRESLRVAKRKGRCFFSTYSDKIWDERLQWFQYQAEEGLLGEIDYKETERGTIVCKDGFVATTFSEDDFLKIADRLRVSCEIVEVDSSSLFAVYTYS